MTDQDFKSLELAGEMDSPTAQQDTNFPGLQPLTADKAHAFWDAINFRIGTSTLNPPEYDELCSLEQPQSYVKIKSFPKPDPSCFVQYYAPLEPLILLPNHFSTTSESLEKLSIRIEDYLKSRDDVAFSSSGSSWSGSILRTSCHCAFRFCVYRSKKGNSLYIVEGQRIEGDGFLFGGLYQGVKARVSQVHNTSLLSSVKSRSLLEDDKMEMGEDSDVEKSGDSGIDDNDLRNFALNVKEMINSEDCQDTLNGIQFAGEMCTDTTMTKFLYNFDLVQDLFNVIKQRNMGFLHEKKWHCQHALVALSHLANNDTESFNRYINGKMIDQSTLSSLLQVELNEIRQDVDGFDGNSTAKIHMIKYANSISQKLI
jgi:hypothetical protein